MNRRAKNMLIGAGTAAVGATLFCTVYKFTLDKLVDLAISRTVPETVMKRTKRTEVAGEALVYKSMPKLLNGKEYIRNCEFETVEIRSRDGLRLVGHWYGGDNPKRVIVAMHGWRSSWINDFAAIAEFWHDNGCAVLYAEQRGQGGSDGAYISFGLLERYDCLEWVKWISERTSLPVYLAGVSMGAATVLMTAGFELPDSVHGIIADCGYTSPKAIWKHVVENNLHIPYGLYSSGVDDMCRKKIQYVADGYSCTDALKNCKVPVFFAHGTDDKFVPVEMTYENYKACASEKRLFIVPGAEHGMSYMTETDKYEQAVKDFWADYDE